jgi:nicotinamide riboside transporter PnuC
MVIATFSTIIGTYLNMLKDPAGFLFWMLANTVFITYSFKEKDHWTGLVFSVYLVMAVVGLYTWI